MNGLFTGYLGAVETITSTPSLRVVKLINFK